MLRVTLPSKTVQTLGVTLVGRKSFQELTRLPLNEFKNVYLSVKDIDRFITRHRGKVGSIRRETECNRVINKHTELHERNSCDEGQNGRSGREDLGKRRPAYRLHNSQDGRDGKDGNRNC